jgi:hypothetical protein
LDVILTHFNSFHTFISYFYGIHFKYYPLIYPSASYPVAGTLSQGVKQLGHEADHSLPYSAKVKNGVALYLHPQYMSMMWCLIKHRDNFIFTYLFLGLPRDLFLAKILYGFSFLPCPSLEFLVT